MPLETDASLCSGLTSIELRASIEQRSSLHTARLAIASSCDDIDDALQGIGALSTSQLQCITHVLEVYAHPSRRLQPSEWQRFCSDLLRQPASGELLLPIAHLQRIYGRVAERAAEDLVYPLIGVAHLLTLLACTAEAWREWNRPSHLSSPDRHVLEGLLQQRLLPRGLPSLTYLLDRIGRFHLGVGETTISELSPISKCDEASPQALTHTLLLSPSPHRWCGLCITPARTL